MASKDPYQHLFAELFRSVPIQAPEFHLRLTSALVTCFHQANSGSTQENAKNILEQLFTEFTRFSGATIPFSFLRFTQHYPLNKSDEKKLIIAVLYGLYFGNIDLVHFYYDDASDRLAFFLFQLIADKCSKKRLEIILNRLSLHEQLALIGHLFQHYREGSTRIIAFFEERDKQLSIIISGLRKKTFAPDVLLKALREKPALTQLIQKLEEETLKLTQACYSLFSSLMKKADRHYSFDEFHQFIQHFGLAGFYPYTKIAGELKSTPTLKEKLQLISDPLTLGKAKPKESESISQFMDALYAHLDALKDPSPYLRGLEKMTCAIATKGKLLAEQPALPSLVSGLDELFKFLKIPLSDYPIFVFDQSNEPLFTKNERFIKKLNRRYKSAIMHVSQDEAVALAKKLNIEKLIVTTETGSFGYGGARNCVFLLTPLFRAMQKSGRQWSKRELKDILHESQNRVLTVDDDVEIPSWNLWAHALFAEEHANSYVACSGQNIGRDTKIMIVPDLKSLLEGVCNKILFSEWVEFPVSADFSEYLTKPQFCLNLPLPSEEEHLRRVLITNPLLHNALHLPGTRYPTRQIPTHFFVGLEEYLKGFLPYILSMTLTLLLNLPGENKREALPWNNKALAENYHSFQDVLTQVTKATHVEEMQKKFWENIATLFSNEGSSLLRDVIKLIVEPDVEAMVARFSDEIPFSATEKASLKAIAELYLTYQKDFALLWEFGSTLDPKGSISDARAQFEKTKKVKFQDYSLTLNFYLLLQVVGKAQFVEAIKNLT